MIKTYLLGFALSALITLLIEHLYFGQGHASTVSLRAIGENLLFSLLSWLGVVGAVAFLAIEARHGFPLYGYGKRLADFEDTLGQEHDDPTDPD